MTLSYIPSDTNDEGILKATASGVLPSGKPVVVNADGTVSVVSQAEGVSDASVFESATTTYTSATFDSNSNKVVIAYTDSGNGEYGTAVVGTVSGGSITFGTPVVFNSVSSIMIAATFDSNSNKVVIGFRGNGGTGNGSAVVGTVSGTAISFGSVVVFTTDDLQHWAATFDTNASKVIFAYSDHSGSPYRGKAVVGTVSGTGISFGSQVQFESGSTSNISATFDSSNNKVVITYKDGGDSNAGKAVVGTVSGTGISFGSLVTYQGGDGVTEGVTTFDSNSNKVVIAYTSLSSGNYGYAIIGTVSGTGISFGTRVQFYGAYTGGQSISFDSNLNVVVISFFDSRIIVGTVSGTSISFGSIFGPIQSAAFDDLSSTFDSNSNTVVLAYKDTGNSNYGTSRLYLPNKTTLTAENYIGMSTGGTYASGSNATVKIIGNTSNDQSSLTAGQAYYVQTDGTIGTTAADPSVFAGTAISATKLLVKT